MAFTYLCEKDALSEGGRVLVPAGKKRILLVWPKGGDIRAFRSLCPHAEVPLDKARFDGEVIVCPKHKWAFDGSNGKCLKPGRKEQLRAYPVRIKDGEIQVNLGNKKNKDKKKGKKDKKKVKKTNAV